MEPNAFLRARKYLDYAAPSKWTAIVAGALTSVLYVLLIVVLGLFFDLLETRGRIPTFADLSPREQRSFADLWRQVPGESRSAALEHLGVTEVEAQEIYASDDLPPPFELGTQTEWAEWSKKRKVGDNYAEAAFDQEIRWRAYVYDLLLRKVGPEAAQLFQKQIASGEARSAILTQWSIGDRRGLGVLASVVHQRESLSGNLLASLASWNLWMWSPSSGADANHRYLLGLLLLAIGLVTLRAFLVILMNWQAAAAALEAATRIRRAIYHHTARLGNLSLRSGQRDEGHELISSHTENVHEALRAYLTHLFRYPLQFFLCLFLAFLAHPLLALIFLPFGSLVWVIGGQLTAAFRRQSQRAALKMTHRETQLVESIGMMRLVKAYLMELFNQSRIERQLAEYSAANQLRSRGEMFARPVFTLLALLGAVSLLYLAGRLILADATDLVNLLLLLMSFASLYLPIQARFEYRRHIRRARDSAQFIFEFLDRKNELSQIADAEFLQPMTRQLELIDVSVREPGTMHMLLRNVNLTIPAGKKIALVGRDENEKLALVSLLPRFFDPSAGEVKIDGRDLKWVTNDSLRAQIGMVLDEYQIFNDTIKNNIGCGESGYFLPQIVEASKLAHAHQLILKLPHGYETLIGELGHELSTVERFQIGLARALLRDPAILVIQEPRHGLDEDAKSFIDDTLHRFLGGRTVIYLAHRISTLKHCDEVILLHEGRVEAVGSHRDLLKTSPRYQHLYYVEFNVFADQAG